MSQSYNQPRAVVHRNILDVAAAEPDASMEGIARRVTGATTPLVERVLENYGDPAAEDADDDETTPSETAEDAGDVETSTADVDASAEDPPTGDAPVIDQTESQTDAEAQPAEYDAESATTTGETVTTATTIDRASLSDAQRETLQVIADRPDASQRDIAAVLDLSQSTVNSRLNSIEGFDWTERASFAAQLVEADGGVKSTPSAAAAQSTDRVDTEVVDRLDGLERQLDALTEAPAVAFDDPELVRSVLQACFESDAVSVDQEREVVAALMGTSRRDD